MFKNEWFTEVVLRGSLSCLLFDLGPKPAAKESFKRKRLKKEKKNEMTTMIDLVGESDNEPSVITSKIFAQIYVSDKPISEIPTMHFSGILAGYPRDEVVNQHFNQQDIPM